MGMIAGYRSESSGADSELSIFPSGCPVTLATSLKSVIESSGLSISAFARRFGVTPGYISQLVNRRLVTIPPDLAGAIAGTFGLPADHFAAHYHEKAKRLTTAASRYRYLGEVAAGKGADAPADTGEWVDIPKECPGADGAYRVSGLSMIGSGIIDGDYLIVRRDPSPESGRIVVAFLHNSGNVVKRLERKRDGDYLHSEDGTKDPRYPVKLGDGDHIHGVLLGLFRPYKPVPPKKRKRKS